MGGRRRSCRPFRARAGGGPPRGCAFGSTPGYIPAAASRLKVFAVLPDMNEVANNALGRGAEKTCREAPTPRHAENVRHIEGFGIEEIAGLLSEEPAFSVERFSQRLD